MGCGSPLFGVLMSFVLVVLLGTGVILAVRKALQPPRPLLAKAPLRNLLGPPPRTARQLRLEHLCEFVQGTIDAKDLALVATYEGVSFRLQLIEGDHPRTMIESNLLAKGADGAVRSAIARKDVAASLSDLRARVEWKNGLLCLSRDDWPHDAVVTMSLVRLVVAIRRAIEEEHEAAERAKIPGFVYRGPGEKAGT